MKIKELNPSILPGVHLEKRKADATKDLDFQKLLGDAGERLNATAQGHSLFDSEKSMRISTNPISSASHLDLRDQDDIALIRSQSLKAVEDTLTILEQYHEGLSDPETSLRKIDPFIQVLTKEVDGLNLFSERLPPADPLRKILNETGILSAVEIEKFRRGEYL
jgi:hypothetical protein